MKNTTHEILHAALSGVDDRYIAEAAQYAPRPLRPGVAVLRRAAALTLALCLCLCAALPALAAADVDGAYAFLYAISPRLAQRMKPVNLACEDGGIRVEVLGVAAAEGEAEILIALTDLTGERVDVTTDLFDSYRLNAPCAVNYTCVPQGYDAASRTATYLLRVTSSEGESLLGDKLTLAMDCFISGKQSFSGTMDAVDLSAAPLAPATQSGVSVRGGANFEQVTTFLVPEEEPIFAPFERAQVTALGFIDDQLHVQVHYDDVLTLDTNGHLTLYTAENEPLQSIASALFWDASRTGSYDEFVFDVSPAQAADCQLYGSFSSAHTRTQGDWEITFALE